MVQCIEGIVESYHLCLFTNGIWYGIFLKAIEVTTETNYISKRDPIIAVREIEIGVVAENCGAIGKCECSVSTDDDVFVSSEGMDMWRDKKGENEELDGGGWRGGHLLLQKIKFWISRMMKWFVEDAWDL